MTPEQWVFPGATAALVLALALGAPFPDRRTLRHPALVGAAVLFLVSVVVRAIFVHPTLIHADLAAPELVDCLLQFPDPCTNRGASYGQYGFWIVGGLARLLGGDLNAVFRAMEIIGALNVALLAVLAYRLSGSPYGALLAVAVTGTNPIFMRVAASEDMHNVGLPLGLIAFITMDVFATTRRILPLVAAVLALALMIYTRQTFHAFVPCVFLLGLARGGRGLLKSPGFWAAGLTVLAVLLLRVLGSDSGNLIQNMTSAFTHPVLLPTMLRYHGLLDAVRFGPLTILTVAAVIWACSAGTVARAVAIVFAVNFLVTYPCGMPSPGVEFAQRLSVFAFGMLLVAMGGAALLETRVRPTHRIGAGLVAAAVLISLPPFSPAWHTLSVLTPIHREYLAVEAAAAALPQEFTLVALPAVDSTFGDSRYAGLLARTGKSVHLASPDDIDVASQSWVFLESIECWTYSFNELASASGETLERFQFAFPWDGILFGRQDSPVRPPPGEHPRCQPFLRSGTPIGPRQVINDPEDDPPFLFYSSSSVPIQFYGSRLPPP